MGGLLVNLVAQRVIWSPVDFSIKEGKVAILLLHGELNVLVKAIWMVQEPCQLL